jgi:phenylpropionate dioxygenase-like ring-hydroxylating dioxygenase large terminal subunit
VFFGGIHFILFLAYKPYFDAIDLFQARDSFCRSNEGFDGIVTRLVEGDKMQIEAITLNEWYPIALLADVVSGTEIRTKVLGTDLVCRLEEDGFMSARRSRGGALYITSQHYGAWWVSLGSPPERLFDIPEFEETDRRMVGLGSMRIHVSGLRAVENFLDMAHFPFVHGGLLGEVPHTEVRPYQVKHELETDELYALGCAFYQPMAAASATGGIDAQYVYRVVRPLTSLLYKTCASAEGRRDIICLFAQPVDEEWCIAHLLLACIDDEHSDSELRLFQQTIVGQDVTILNNHWPRTLPLDPKFEVPARADAMSGAYRRWLREKGVRYGTYRPVARQGGVAA